MVMSVTYFYSSHCFTHILYLPPSMLEAPLIYAPSTELLAAGVFRSENNGHATSSK